MKTVQSQAGKCLSPSLASASNSVLKVIKQPIIFVPYTCKIFISRWTTSLREPLDCDSPNGAHVQCAALAVIIWIHRLFIAVRSRHYFLFVYLLECSLSALKYSNQNIRAAQSKQQSRSIQNSRTQKPIANVPKVAKGTQTNTHTAQAKCISVGNAENGTQSQKQSLL